MAEVYLVLGATGGIGSAVVRRLENDGSVVAIAGRDEKKLDTLDVASSGGRFPVEASDADQVESVVQAILATSGRLDGIVNCVGSLLLKPAHLTGVEEWDATIRTNLGSAFSVVRAAGRLMPGGSVVLLSSAAARVGIANHEAIAAAKAGVVGLMRSAAATYAPKGLRFNAVSPGLIRTPLTERITGNPAAEKASAAMHALGRIGEPEDVARLIGWLLSPENDWVTGQVFGVDGGLATVRAKSRK